jgi:protein tyrosine/serine phosphatase
VRHQAVALLIALSSVLPALAAAPAGSLANIRIDNFGSVNDNYYRGAQPAGRDYADLAALGVKTVIDLTAGDDATEAESVKAAGMKFVRMPMTTHDDPAPETVSRFLALVNDPANLPVFVHCAGGRHRTGVMTAVYRMRQDGWNADRAFAEMQKYRFGPAFLHATLKNFVYGYYDQVSRADRVAQRPAVAAKAAN